MSWRLRIATCFGPHSRRVWRCVIGATWSLPLRYFTLAAQLAAIAAVPGVQLRVPTSALLYAMSAGVLVGWVLSLLDRLAVEFALFPAVRRYFVGGKP